MAKPKKSLTKEERARLKTKLKEIVSQLDGLWELWENISVEAEEYQSDIVELTTKRVTLEKKLGLQSREEDINIATRQE